MTYADSSLALLGRSRNTSGSAPGVASLFPTRQLPLLRVILRVWGQTPNDADDARSAALASAGAGLWEVAEIISTHGGPCPIPLHDSIAVGQGADYGYAWGAYREWSAR